MRHTVDFLRPGKKPESWINVFLEGVGDTLVVKAFRALVCTRKFRKPHACPKNMRQSGEVAQ